MQKELIELTPNDELESIFLAIDAGTLSEL